MAMFRFTPVLRSGAGVFPYPVTRALRLLFQVLLIAGGATAAIAATASGAGLKERIESAAVETTFDTEGGHVRQIRVANDLVVFLVDKEDSSLVLAYDLAGTRQFRFAAGIADSGYIHWVTVSDDGSTLVIRQMLEAEWYDIRVFNIESGEWFRVQTASGLEPSPSGKRFCMQATEVSAQPLDLFDEEGHKIRQLLPGSETWMCRFIDDDHLLIADGEDTLRLIDANSGTTIWARCLQFESEHAIPRLTVSRATSAILVYDWHNLLCLTPENRELWRKSYVGDLKAVITDDDSPRAVLAFFDTETRSGKALAVSLIGGESLGDAIKLSRAQTPTYGSERYTSFSRGILTAKVPTYIPGYRPAEVRDSTMFLVLDDSSGSFYVPVIVSGCYSVVPSITDSPRVIRVLDSEAACLGLWPLD